MLPVLPPAARVAAMSTCCIFTQMEPYRLAFSTIFRQNWSGGSGEIGQHAAPLARVLKRQASEYVASAVTCGTCCSVSTHTPRLRNGYTAESRIAYLSVPHTPRYTNASANRYYGGSTLRIDHQHQRCQLLYWIIAGWGVL